MKCRWNPAKTVAWDQRHPVAAEIPAIIIGTSAIDHVESVMRDRNRERHWNMRQLRVPIHNGPFIWASLDEMTSLSHQCADAKIEMENMIWKMPENTSWPKTPETQEIEEYLPESNLLTEVQTTDVRTRKISEIIASRRTVTSNLLIFYALRRVLTRSISSSAAVCWKGWSLRISNLIHDWQEIKWEEDRMNYRNHLDQPHFQTDRVTLRQVLRNTTRRIDVGPLP